MPSFNCSYKDLVKLLKRDVDLGKLEEFLEKTKSELKGYDKETDELKLENVDTNRPDLWMAEGIARQLRQSVFEEKMTYPFFDVSPEENQKIIVDTNLKDIRPYIGGFLVKNIQVDDAFLKQLIQTQEKLCDNYGRFRELIAIGVYDASKIEFPIKYKGFKPDEMKFAPLGFEEEITLSEILEKHPTGKEYAKLVKSFPLYPVIMDSKDNVLSFPPVINSNDLGRVEVGNTFLFVEVTGTELDSVILATNILACNLYDRGGEILPFNVVYSDKTGITPYDFKQVMTLEHKYLEKMIGQSISREEVVKFLTIVGFDLTEDNGRYICQSPPYRRDCLHQVDLVEDFAISKGYNSFALEMPEKFTTGSSAPVVDFAAMARKLMIGMGFQEFMTYILTSGDKLFGKMNRLQKDVLEVENVMSDNFSILRPSLLPILLEVESKSMRIEFPHRIFEEGEVVVVAPEENFGCKTLLNLGAVISHGEANFSEIHSYLHSLMFYLNIPYRLEETTDPSFISGRAGKIICRDKEVGLIGEIHPGVLENWGITVPSAAFEITMDYIM